MSMDFDFSMYCRYSIFIMERELIMDTKKHLCATCLNEFPTCQPDRIEFGDGIGNDNVIDCSSYNERKLVNIAASYQVMNCKKPIYENKNIKE